MSLDTHQVSHNVQSRCMRPFFASTESQESKSDMNIAPCAAMRIKIHLRMLYIRSILSEPELVIAESKLVFFFILCSYDIFIRALFYIIPALAISVLVNITKFMEVRL